MICGTKKGCFQTSPYKIQQKFDISNAPAVYQRIEEIQKNDSPGRNASCCRDEKPGWRNESFRVERCCYQFGQQMIRTGIANKHV